MDVSASICMRLTDFCFCELSNAEVKKCIIMMFCQIKTPCSQTLPTYIQLSFDHFKYCIWYINKQWLGRLTLFLLLLFDKFLGICSCSWLMQFVLFCFWMSFTCVFLLIVKYHLLALMSENSFAKPFKNTNDIQNKTENENKMQIWKMN